MLARRPGDAQQRDVRPHLGSGPRAYWQTTRNYVEQFLRDVADGSGTLTSPYAVTTQYTDASGRAANSSLYGGGCIDYGTVGGSACQFGNTNGTGPGHDYPVSDCPVTGTNQSCRARRRFGTGANDICLTDAQIQDELTTMIAQTACSDTPSRATRRWSSLLTPPGVVTCLDSAGTLCSANSAASARPRSSAPTTRRSTPAAPRSHTWCSRGRR